MVPLKNSSLQPPTCISFEFESILPVHPVCPSTEPFRNTETCVPLYRNAAWYHWPNVRVLAPSAQLPPPPLEYLQAPGVGGALLLTPMAAVASFRSTSPPPGPAAAPMGLFPAAAALQGAAR